MPAPTIGTIFNISDILSSEVDPKTNTITCQLGDAVAARTAGDKDTQDAAVFCKNAEYWAPYGFASIPPNVPASKDAPQALSISRSDNEIIIAVRNGPGQAVYGTQFSAGDCCMYGNGADGKGQSRILIKGDTGAINLYATRDNLPGETALGIFIAPQSDTVQILNSKAYASVIDIDGIKITAGKSSIQVLGSGDIKSSATGLNQIDGKTIVIGSAAIPTNDALHNSKALIAALTAITAALTAISAIGINASTAPLSTAAVNALATLAAPGVIGSLKTIIE